LPKLNKNNLCSMSDLNLGQWVQIFNGIVSQWHNCYKEDSLINNINYVEMFKIQESCAKAFFLLNINYSADVCRIPSVTTILDNALHWVSKGHVSQFIFFLYPKLTGCVMGLKLVHMAAYQGPLYKVKYRFMQPNFIGTRSCGSPIIFPQRLNLCLWLVLCSKRGRFRLQICLIFYHSKIEIRI
jgi:hypothetical protein